MRNCPDCGVMPGEVHVENCDVERCAGCGGQRLCCDCGDQMGLLSLPWTGVWPGEAECREYGLWCRWVEGAGWVICDKEHPDARPDLNTLISTCRWSQAEGRFVRS